MKPRNAFLASCLLFLSMINSLDLTKESVSKEHFLLFFFPYPSYFIQKSLWSLIISIKILLKGIFLVF